MNWKKALSILIFSFEKLGPFILLIASPLIQYHWVNRALLSTKEVVTYYGVFLAFPVLLSLLLKERFRVWGLSLLFAYYLLPSLHAELKISSATNPFVRWSFVLAVFGFVSVVYRGSYSVLKYLSIAFFVGNTLLTVSKDTPREEISVHSSPPLQSRKTEYRPDVLLLMYDAYPNPTVCRDVGVNNARMYEFLKIQGFTLYPNTYSLYMATLGSVGRMLDMSLSPSASIGGANTVNQAFREMGYELRQVLSKYFYTDTQKVIVDDVFPESRAFGQFSFLAMGLLSGEFKAETAYSGFTRQEWLSAKRAALKKATSRPVFLYAHSPFPGHSQNSGHCLPNETDLWKQRLDEANKEIVADLALVNEVRKNAIVIVASDHGPALRGDCYMRSDITTASLTAADLRDQYGTFVAIRWLKKMPRAEISILQDVFFEVLAHLYGDPKIRRQKLPQRTFGRGFTIKGGAVDRGRVQCGVDTGKKLYD